MTRQRYIQGRFLAWAEKHDITVPDFTSRKNFTFHPLLDSPESGTSLAYFPLLANNISALKDICLWYEECVAFSTDGRLRSILLPQDKWVTNIDSVNQGLYISQVDICKADMHNCDARYKKL